VGLIRTILALVILLILVHVGLVYAGIDQGTNAVTDAIYSLGALLEAPATVLLNAVSSTGQIGQYADNFYVIALTAAAGYFIIYLLLGVGRR
jgi:broad specificity polyphosphatase/5'/3'-nucleotidase SurE